MIKNRILAPKAVIFDCDGVMFDSAKANREYYNRILTNLGKPPLTDEQFAFAHMATVHQVIERLFPDPAQQQKAHALRKELGYFPFIKLMVMEPHLKELLGLLQQAKKRAAVATNRTNTMNWVLEQHGIAEFFEMVVTALDVKKPKPDAEQLLKILNAFGLKPDEAIYIGDTQVDEKAAIAAKVPFVSYNNPQLAADWHIEGLLQLKEMLF
ncbi:MAG: HAD-IA family hydrolase [Desulfatibacillaceae bacterium]|nr:HAD-IA family hydrolase [Desulfatibacillaceae bacterium]